MRADPNSWISWKLRKRESQTCTYWKTSIGSLAKFVIHQNWPLRRKWKIRRCWESCEKISACSRHWIWWLQSRIQKKEWQEEKKKEQEKKRQPRWILLWEKEGLNSLPEPAPSVKSLQWGIGIFHNRVKKGHTMLSEIDFFSWSNS